MKLTPQILRRIIREEIEQDIAKAVKAGPAAVRSLANNANDKQGLKDALKGSHDKVSDDDVVSVSGAKSIAVKKFKPTQKEIDLLKSIGYPLSDFSILKKMISTNTSTAPGSITVSGDLVIDGHHRWSGIWGISGPSGVISAEDLGLPGDTTQKLAAAQLAIAAYKPADVKQPAAAGAIPYNILGASPDTIKSMLLKNKDKTTERGSLLGQEFLDACAGDNTVAQWAGFKPGADKKEVLEKICDKVADNLSTLPSNPQAPERIDMPQFNDDSIGGDKAKEEIYTGLKSGEFNVKAPFKPGDKEDEEESKEKELSERFLRLAGII